MELEVVQINDPIQYYLEVIKCENFENKFYENILKLITWHCAITYDKNVLQWAELLVEELEELESNMTCIVVSWGTIEAQPYE